MRRFALRAGLTLSTALLPGTLAGQRDLSAHQERFVNVGAGVRVEVLDWGGRGPAILMIPGYGFSAHVYDDFAPRLIGPYHVLALTVRGWSPSDAPATGYTYDRVAADIKAVAESLGLRQVVLVGHSFGGAIITRTAIRYPSLVRAVIYMDGALQDTERDSVFRLNPIRRPAPPEAQDTTMASQIATWRQYAEHNFYGDWTPALEADLWARGTGVTDAEFARRDSLVRRFGVEDPVDKVQPNYGAFGQPSLAICAVTTSRYQYPWLTHRSPEWAQAERFTTEQLMPFQRYECGRFQREARRGENLLLESGHYIFINAPAATAGAILSFLDKLQ